jgi:hypothetical protein
MFIEIIVELDLLALEERKLGTLRSSGAVIALRTVQL